MRRMAMPMAIAMVMAAAAMLAGCQSSPVITQTSYDVLFRAGVPSEFGYAAAGGEMPVIVVGNPFQLDQARVDQAVVDAMQGRARGAGVRFVNGPAESARPGYAVVTRLDAPPGAPAGAMCDPARREAAAGEGGGEAATRQDAGGRSTLLAVFCGGSDARSWAWSSGPRAASPEDPAFAQLVAQTTFLMLPPRDDEPRSRDYR